MKLNSRTLRLAAVGLMGLGAVTAVSPLALAETSGFADLAAKVAPAVVTISAAHEARKNGQPELPFQFPEGSPFEDFFSHFRQFQDNGAGEPDGQDKRRQATALGSGFVVDASGYIVTNYHVIDGADDIEVTLNDHRTLPAKLIGTDKRTDLALLKIDAGQSLPTVAFGDSDEVRVGDWAIAVGNPFGLGGTVTVGVVSARGRDLNAGPFDDFLQVDAPINQGNSGGPLFDGEGRVVGVNTAIVSPNGGSVGIGFAIPSNLARPVIDQLKSNGSVARGWLGVQIQPLTDAIAAAVGLDNSKGALVAAVQPGSPAEKAGIDRGDVILSFDGQAIEEVRDMPRIVAGTPIGREVTLVVWRDHARRTLDATVAALADTETSMAAAPETGDAASSSMGVQLSAITPETQAQFDLPEDVEGVLVVDVVPDGPAAKEGMRAGDVIEEVANKPVRQPEEVEQGIEAAKSTNTKSVLVLLNRGGDALYVTIPVGNA